MYRVSFLSCLPQKSDKEVFSTRTEIFGEQAWMHGVSAYWAIIVWPFSLHYNTASAILPVLTPLPYVGRKREERKLSKATSSQNY